MNLKACIFDRLAFISLGFGRGAQAGKTSLLEVNLYGGSVDVGRIHLFVTLQDLGSHQNSRSLEEDDYVPGSGPVLCHSSACVRDVLTAPSNVHLKRSSLLRESEKLNLASLAKNRIFFEGGLLKLKIFNFFIQK